MKTKRAEAGIRPPAGYRYADDCVRYESLDNKGLHPSYVLNPPNPGWHHYKPNPEVPFQAGREMPSVPFAAGPEHAGKTGSIRALGIPVTITEEAGVDRESAVLRFGFPLPQGGLFDARRLQLIAPDGEALPAQFTPISRWADGSLKWVLIDAHVSVAARSKANLTVQAGVDAGRAGKPSPLSVTEEEDTITVVTGPLRAVIDKRCFTVLNDIRFDAEGAFASAGRIAGCTEGVCLLDENGRLFTTANAVPESCILEERGPERVVVRVKGKYADASGRRSMAYTTRLAFQAGSARVTIEHTHLNDHLETEFSDITSLTLPFVLPDTVAQAVTLLPAAAGKFTCEKGEPLSIFQIDDRRSEVRAGSKRIEAGRLTGAMSLRWKSGALGCVIHDFWQRWPKGAKVAGRELALGLLPEQPTPNFGAGLPPHLMFPFVKGKYRFKWGMSFTQKVTLDFSGQASLEELVAEAQTPLVAVLPAEWYQETQALGPMVAPKEKQFALWDAFVEKSFRAHLELSERQREYGFFNYGDWWGERHCNWGNNEYDIASCLFMEFARTGGTDYYRRALQAARHQADVDIVHAYPNRYYVGANLKHSISHTGKSGSVHLHGDPDFPPATWSDPYDCRTDATNGHTWSKGMTCAWFLSGEARVMEAAIELGEHIAWGMSRHCQSLGAAEQTEERAVGWALLAILHLYQVNYDGAYLQAARRIAGAGLKDQIPPGKKVWPWPQKPLPRDHSPEGLDGNCHLMLAIMLQALAEYHRITRDPEVWEPLKQSCEWIIKSWCAPDLCWPIASTPEGAPATPLRWPRLNPMIVAPLAYAGNLLQSGEIIAIVEKALRPGLYFEGAESIGKELAECMAFMPSTFSNLDSYYRKQDPQSGLRLFNGGDEELVQTIATIPRAAKHSVLGPARRTFCVKSGKKDCLLTASRSLIMSNTVYITPPIPPGKGLLTVLDQSGQPICRREFDVTEPETIQAPLPGSGGEEFQVVIEDGEWGAWSLEGDGIQVVIDASQGLHVHVGSPRRYAFFVPSGTSEFGIRIAGVHHGGFGLAAVPPDNVPAAYLTGSNTAGIASFPGEASVPLREIKAVVRPQAEQTGKMWDLVLYADYDLRCGFEGVPPWLALNAASWFAPVSGRIHPQNTGCGTRRPKKNINKKSIDSAPEPN